MLLVARPLFPDPWPAGAPGLGAWAFEVERKELPERIRSSSRSQLHGARHEPERHHLAAALAKSLGELRVQGWCLVPRPVSDLGGMGGAGLRMKGGSLAAEALKTSGAQAAMEKAQLAFLTWQRSRSRTRRGVHGSRDGG